MKNLLDIYNLEKSYGGHHLLQGVDMHLKNNSINLLTGDNGTGKTTFFNIIAGLEKPDAGKIEFANRNVININSLGRAKLGMTRLFQNPRIFRSLTIQENIKVATKDEYWLSKSYDLLVEFGLGQKFNSIAGTLSYGQQKILAYCTTMVSQPKLILLDEPLAGLATDVIPVIRREFLSLKQTGSCLLIIEHQREEIKDICDNEYTLKNRKIEFI